MTIIDEIRAERERQRTAEGWTEAHDDRHDGGQMALAAACYAISSTDAEKDDEELMDAFDTLWPWDEKYWKPKDPRRDLIRAAALIVAEIERLDRAEQKKDGKKAAKE